MKNFELILNQRKNFNLTHDNHIFNKENRNKKENEWGCANRKCGALGVVQKNEEFVLKKMHMENCECSSQIIKMKLLNVLKEKSENGIRLNLSIITSSTKK
jgi:hypothetical protein